MTTTEFMWLKHGTPIPKGWKLSDQAMTHHHQYAALIEREQPTEEQLKLNQPP